jgi:hypothetical protein
MKPFAILLLSVSLAVFGAPAFAAGDQQASRSAGKLKHDESIDLPVRLSQQETLVRDRPTEPENYAASLSAQRFAGIANRHDQLFEIYDADVTLISDLDGDGYHHALNVYFDADVDYGVANVYAKLYLSREGEPWSQYYTTDLFHIDGDAVEDAYEVETELVDGYEPGYYDVLIEIYSLDHAYMVASEVLDYHYLGRDVPLEDLFWDEPHISAHGGGSVSHGHGGGSFAALLLFFLIVQVVIAARGAFALTPGKKSENYKKKRLP